MQTMKGFSAVMVLVVAALLGGCAMHSPDPTANEPGKPSTAPDDKGGYAKDLGSPPAKVGDVDVTENIAKGESTDTHEDPTPPKADQLKANADKAAAAAKTPPAKTDAADLEQAKEADHSGDKKYKDHDKPVIAVQTKHGVFYAELWPDKAPKTVKAILGLVRKQFYDGIYVHRVVRDFVVQAGDALTRGKGGNAPGAGSGDPGFTIPAEFNDTKHDRGILSMARKGNDVNSASSQFFICLSREHCAPLDGQYTAFGKVLGAGMDQVSQIAADGPFLEESTPGKGDMLHHVWIVRDLPEGQR